MSLGIQAGRPAHDRVSRGSPPRCVWWDVVELLGQAFKGVACNACIQFVVHFENEQVRKYKHVTIDDVVSTAKDAGVKEG